MSRKYLNDKYCVRCGRTEACPYLRKNVHLLDNENKNLQVVDIGCGNGRNSKFIKKRGHNVISLDMVDDYGYKIILGKDKLPAKNNSIDIILCNYLMMFLNKKERSQLIREMKRIAKNNCMLMLELYPAKDCYAKTENEMLAMQYEIFKKMNWEKIRYSRGRFIAKK